MRENTLADETMVQAAILAEHKANTTKHDDDDAEITFEIEQAPRSLAQLLADRQAEREQDRAEAAVKAAAEREEQRIDALAHMRMRIDQIMSAELQAALDVMIVHDPDQYGERHPAVALLTIDPDELHAWRVRYVNRRLWDNYSETDLVIEGPHRYQVKLPGYHPPVCYDSQILDAISAYAEKLPELLGQERIEQEKERREQEREEREWKPVQLPHYRYTTSGSVTDYPYCGLLHHGAHVTVYMVPAVPKHDEQQTHYTGIVESYDETWILLTCDGSKRQRLLPIARVDEILPEQPITPARTETEPEPEPERTEATTAPVLARIADQEPAIADILGVTCSACNGKGERMAQDWENGQEIHWLTQCNDCHGTGRVRPANHDDVPF